MLILGTLGVFIGILIPTSIIALIVCAAINKEKGNSVMKFNIGVKSVYTYVILIATLYMIIAGSICAVSSLLDYFLPESELELTEEDCTDNYSSGYCEVTTKDIRVKNEKNEGITSFASCTALVLIATLLFVTYSKEAKKLREIKLEAKEELKETAKPKAKSKVKAKQE